MGVEAGGRGENKKVNEGAGRDGSGKGNGGEGKWGGGRAGGGGVCAGRGNGGVGVDLKNYKYGNFNVGVRLGGLLPERGGGSGSWKCNIYYNLSEQRAVGSKYYVWDLLSVVKVLLRSGDNSILFMYTGGTRTV